MQNKNIQIILRYIVMFCLYAIVFAPLLLCADFFFPAIFPKAIYIRLLTEIALVAYVPLAILEPKYRPKFNIIYIAIAIFALIVLITSILGENFTYSMWGNYERMDGIFSWAHYWVLIVIAASVLQLKRDWMKLFSFSLVCAVLMSFYGFLQRFGLDHFGPWTIYETNMGRITSTIGNPAFFAVYLFFNITFAFLIIINKYIATWWRAIVGIGLIPLFIAYFMTGVRGAAIGLILGIIIFVFGYIFWMNNKKMKQIIIACFIGFIILMSILFVFKDSSFVTNNAFLGRLFSMRLSDPTIQTRLLSWGVECENGFGTCGAIKGAQENFWFGVGPQKFDIIFNKYFDPNFYTLVGTETWWDRAHNMVLEVFATMGIFGLISYLSIGLSMLYLLFQIGKQQKEFRAEALIIFAFLGGYFVQNLFVFDTISSYVVLVVFIGYIISISIPFNFAREKFDKFRSKFHFHISSIFRENLLKYWWVSIIIMILLVAPCAYFYNIKLLEHNHVFLLNLSYSNSNSLNKTLNDYRKVVEISDFDNREVAIKIGQYAGQYALEHQMKVNELQSMYRFVINTMEESIKKNPKDARLLLSFGNSLNIYAEIIKQYDIQESLRILRKTENALIEAVELGKARQQVFYSLANTYIISGNVKKGVEILEEAVKINENTPKAHWILSFAYAQAGENQKAIQSCETAIEKGYRISSESEVIMIAKLYVDEKDYKGLLSIYQEVAKNVLTGTAQAKVASVLAQMGRKNEAIEEARKVLIIDPSLKKEVDEFIRKVESGEKIDFLNQP